MATKDELVGYIQSYLKIEDEMKVLQKELKDRKEMKKKLNEQLVAIMKSNEIDVFEIAGGDKIIYTKNKLKGGLNKKHLIEYLGKYFQDTPNVNPEEVSNYILDSREVKVKESIRHKISK